MPDAGTTRTFLFPRDLEGHWQGLFDIRPSQSWYGWDVGSVAQAGIVLQWCCGYTYLQHFNALGSTLMTTDQTGAVQRQQIYGPWGQGWEYYGNWFTVRYAGMDFPGLQGNDVASFRDYNPTMGRWLMPDPAGRAAANPANPQSWNMYAYVGDNPTSLNDPSGLVWVDAGNCSYDQEPYGAVSDGIYTPSGRGVGGLADLMAYHRQGVQWHLRWRPGRASRCFGHDPPIPDQQPSECGGGTEAAVRKAGRAVDTGAEIHLLACVPKHPVPAKPLVSSGVVRHVCDRRRHRRRLS